MEFILISGEYNRKLIPKVAVSQDCCFWSSLTHNPWAWNTIGKLSAVYLHEIQAAVCIDFSKMFIIGLFLIQ